MTKTQHTPGPWFVFNESHTLAVMARDRKEVIHWSGFDACDFQRAALANARLIAAAPQLLDFAKYVLEMDPKSDAPLFTKARAAIKATTEDGHA